ncbi:MAG: class II aldolase/adducin family protein [Rhodospirillaceae bacterium]|jgi:ribulose-5-phosphate 4-epimerase/fuculose-1-phosphate aldolase|nr:class II aldolase/adducin family protein [Rhodospirillaceae bacterium]MBT5190771.1 class II aldolase/adducin family protein [Rhodospirillaceae bacterium]MBT5897352.1 class II aldolase/adducin family protein [Rhodospirillaceae bacterium]MBT6430313.1 class II aldolase/adducin family protein [Rhodospirillaceae bacterium]MBT7663898.1 class II aldolase/adducin family protein [Rhodospirillaceae bacterium]
MNVVRMQQKVSETEWQARVDLAACYRLAAHYGWTDLILTHISARVPDETGPDGGECFLINPMGYMFHEITASCLVKVDINGKVLSESDYDINPAGFTIHSAVHGARPDVGCVMHLHTDDGVAVSSQAHGLLPLTQTAMTVSGNISYHDYEGIALDLDERSRLVANLGDSNIMILRNHGTMTCGPDVQQAFLSMFMLERACTMQIRALSGGTKLNMPSDKSIETVKNQMASGSGSLAGLAWPSLLRMLDGMDPSFRD